MKRISFLVAALFAGQTWATDLLSLYREAQLQDSTYAGAKAQYIGAQDKLPQAKALLLPSVNFAAGTHYNEVDTSFKNSAFVDGRRDFYDYNFGVNVTQPLYRRQNNATLEQAKVQVGLYREMFKQRSFLEDIAQRPPPGGQENTPGLVLPDIVADLHLALPCTLQPRHAAQHRGLA